MSTININVIQDYMFDITNNESLNEPKSDHALIRVELDNFFIYSLNILNGEDISALNMTIKNFKEIKNKKLAAQQFLENNSDRMEGIFNRLLSITEEKPIIFCFQEVGPEIAELIKNKFEEMQFIASEHDMVLYYDKETKEMKTKVKEEKRIILLPKEMEILQKIDIQIPNVKSAYKTSLLIGFSYLDKVYYLCNVHINFKTNVDQLIEFLNKFSSYDDLVMIGDFNTNLIHFNDNLVELGLNYKIPAEETFISEMGLENLEKSKIIDQVIYKLSESTNLEEELGKLSIGGGNKIRFYIKY